MRPSAATTSRRSGAAGGAVAHPWGRLDPDLKRALLLRAADEEISVSEAVRRAIGQYLRAS
ncbi:MAG: ribbon-helix-helix protein, CopG family [Sciscionella sp.]